MLYKFLVFLIPHQIFCNKMLFLFLGCSVLTYSNVSLFRIFYRSFLYLLLFLAQNESVLQWYVFVCINL